MKQPMACVAALALFVSLVLACGDPGREEDPVHPVAAVFEAAAQGQDVAARRFRECEVCPEMVAVPGGSFLLGSPETEAGRDEDEGPRTRVTVPPLAVSRFEITRGEYATFVEATSHQGDGACLVLDRDGVWEVGPQASWREPGFDQGEDHPVVCASWDDARAYVEWLDGHVAGSPYRLLSESEWEYAARAGTETPYWWGREEGDFCAYTNGVDALARERYPGWVRAGACSDGFVYTAPVGHYGAPSSFGLEDLVGNAWEWVEDCYRPSFERHPTDGSAYLSADCERRVLRGGAWGDHGSFYLRTAYRGAWESRHGFANLGFRVARELPHGLGATSSSAHPPGAAHH